jgi:hypothetical protein
MLTRGSLAAPLLVLTAVFVTALERSHAQTGAPSGSLVISQVFGGGGNTGAPLNADYVELFNRGSQAVSLAGLSIQYASATGTGNFGATSAQLAALNGTLQPGQRFLVQLAGGPVGSPLPTPDLAGTINMSATAGKVAIVNSTTSLGCNGGSTPCSPAQLALIVDLIGYGSANFFEGSGPAPALSVSMAAFRLAGGCTDSNHNSADFTTSAPAPRNSAFPIAPCGNPTNPAVAGATTPSPVEQGQLLLVTGTVTPGTNPASTALAVRGDLSVLGGLANQPLLDDGLPPDATAGDGVFTTTVLVPAMQPPGMHPYSLAVTDAQSRSGSFNGMVTVVSPPPLVLPHDVQGSGAVSPVTPGTVVNVEGVVTARKFNGFFLQTQPGREDGDAATSEGLFVFTGSAGAPAGAAVGNLVRATGVVAEFVPAGDPASPPFTELTALSALAVLGTAVVPDAVTLDASVSPDGPFDQLERFEGMRVAVTSLTAVSGTEGSVNESQATAASTGAFYAVVTGTPRPFREAGIEVPQTPPLCEAGSGCAIPVFDANPERLRIDTDALEGLSPVDVSTGAVLTGVSGPLDFSFRTYTILAETPPLVAGGLAAMAAPAPGSDQFTIASFNLQRFYDTVDDPLVSDVVLAAAALERRLAKASGALRLALHSPAIVAVQEIESLDVLSALASRVNADRGLGCPGDAACYRGVLEEGNDVGGIDVGFLVQERVTIHESAQWGRDLQFSYPCPTGTCLALMNDRPSLAIRATVAGSASSLPADVLVLVNHLRSLNGVDDPIDGPRVRAKRHAQAEFLAGVLDDLQTTWPNTTIVSVGDYNAFELNDGFVDVMGTVRGQPAPATEVVLASPDLVDPDFLDAAASLPAGERYSYIFGGNAQSLDHALVSANALGSFTGVAPLAGLAYARINADFPEALRSDGTRVERLSDHDPLVVYLRYPPDTIPPELSGVPGDITTDQTTAAGALVVYTQPAAVDNLDGPVPVTCAPPSGSVFPLGETVVTCTATDAAGNQASQSFLVTVRPAPGGAMHGAGQIGSRDAWSTFAFQVVGGSTSVDRGWLIWLVPRRSGPDVLVSTQVTFMTVSAERVVRFEGVGCWNGIPGYMFEATAADRGRPGTGVDTFAVTVRDPSGASVAASTGTLIHGEVGAIPR